MHCFYLRCIFFVFTVKTYCVITEREVNSMSPKELLYIEDALGHEKQIKATCTQCAEIIQDSQLKSLVSEIASKHANTFSDLYRLL